MSARADRHTAGRAWCWSLDILILLALGTGLLGLHGSVSGATADANQELIRTPREDWDQARETVRTNQVWAQWVMDRKLTVNDWISKQSDHVEWVAGWMHDYADEQGRMLPWTATNRPNDDGSQSARRILEGWNHIFRSQHVDRVLDAAYLYSLTKEERYANWAREQIDFYSENYLLWPEQHRQGISRIMGQSLDEATILIRMAETVRLLGNYIDKTTKLRWHEKLFMPATQNLKRSLNGVNNISIWQLSALIVVGVDLDDASLVRAALSGPQGLEFLLQRGLTSDAIWHEGSLSYNRYVIRALVPGLEALIRFKPNLSATEIQLFQALKGMAITPMLMRFEDQTLPTPGDATEWLSVPDTDVLRLMRRIMPLPYTDLAGTSKKARTWADLVDPVGHDSPVKPMPEVTSRLFPGSSMGQLRNAFWQVFMHWGQVSLNHAQKEALNVEIQAGTARVSRDSGTVLYGSAWHQKYYSQAAAHNVALTDDIGQEGWNPGELIEFKTSPPRIQAKQPRYNRTSSVTRTISLHDEILEDRLLIARRPEADNSTKTVGATWHFDCKINDIKGLLGPSQEQFPKQNGFEYWKNVRAERASGQVSFLLDCGGTRHIQTTLSLPDEFTFFIGQAAGPQQQQRNSIYIRKSGTEATVQTTFKPVRPAD